MSTEQAEPFADDARGEPFFDVGRRITFPSQSHIDCQAAVHLPVVLHEEREIVRYLTSNSLTRSLDILPKAFRSVVRGIDPVICAGGGNRTGEEVQHVRCNRSCGSSTALCGLRQK